MTARPVPASATTLRTIVLTALGALLMLAPPAPASARITESLPWTFSQVFRTSVRLVRVDLGCDITERDEDAGYLTFDYESSGRLHHGSIEIVPGDAGTGVRVIVQIPTLPTYVERMVVNRLERKLRDEIGEPPAHRGPEAPRGPAAPPDDDAPAAPDEPDDDVEEPTHDASDEVPPGPYW